MSNKHLGIGTIIRSGDNSLTGKDRKRSQPFASHNRLNMFGVKRANRGGDADGTLYNQLPDMQLSKELTSMITQNSSGILSKTRGTSKKMKKSRPSLKRDGEPRIVEEYDQRNVIVTGQDVIETPNESKHTSKSALDQSKNSIKDINQVMSVAKIRQSRQKVEHDVKRLHNRIQLLELEEEKALKIIEDTK